MLREREPTRDVSDQKRVNAMSTPTTEIADDFSWAGPELRERLRRDPAEVLQDRGINVPPEIPAGVVVEFARIACLLWVDGRLTSVDRFSIDPADEGLLFGRGAWESTRTVGGVPWLWPLHLDRIRQTAKLLNLNVTPERFPTQEQVAEYVRGLSTQDVVVRLNATAGRPGKPGIVWMSAAAMPMAPVSLKLRSCPSPVQKGQAYLTLKTFQYATRLRIGQQAHLAGFDSALLVDTQGNIEEAAHANIFFKFDDGWATPPADGGLLPGTVRQFLLKQSPVPIREIAVPLARLPEVREAFVTNSNIGIIPVTQIDNQSLPVGPETQSFLRWLHPPQSPGTQYRFVERTGIPR
jgi:branched-subunit amino acid aminotransferase/4-amino-4-deoxychorismate lyase